MQIISLFLNLKLRLMSGQTTEVLAGKYCNSLTQYSRFLTQEVNIGGVPLGGEFPIRIQSMTTADTMDTEASVAESIRMIEAGCEYVRLTAPSIKEAQNLAVIKSILKDKGYQVPLIADIHFTPNAAELAAKLVDKVRVNPGNYADKKKFEDLEFTPQAYQKELERIKVKFAPLVNICKQNGTAMRIGTNHGSLSDRIMSWYGDTPKGMVESAMEFIRICHSMDYHQLVVSMKASNPQVMVQAYRLLVQTMVAEGMNYPLHLGVTEAGDGEDGRIKSAVGIGSLLEDGLGDTIRVSLTEDPEFEIPVAKALVKRYVERAKTSSNVTNIDVEIPANYSPFEYNKRQTAELNTFIGGHQVPRVIVDISQHNLKDAAVLNDAGYLYNNLLDKYNMADQSVDFAYMGDNLPSFNFPGNLKQLYNYTTWQKLENKKNCHPLFTLKQYLACADDKDGYINLVKIDAEEYDSAEFAKLQLDESLVVILETSSNHGMAQQRAFFFKLMNAGIKTPVIIKRDYNYIPHPPQIEDKMAVDNPVSLLQLYAGTDFGALLIDGLGDGIWLEAQNIPTKNIVSTAFGILQATRSRISKTEYISCPSCGRTLFDLQETTQMIRSRTDHLKGLKIGIMGCIVNGPGEMADADYGYVGTGPGKITLYRGKQVVKKSVSSDNALDDLIDIIKLDGLWIDK